MVDASRDVSLSVKTRRRRVGVLDAVAPRAAGARQDQRQPIRSDLCNCVDFSARLRRSRAYDFFEMVVESHGPCLIYWILDLARLGWKRPVVARRIRNCTPIAPLVGLQAEMAVRLLAACARGDCEVGRALAELGAFRPLLTLDAPKGRTFPHPRTRRFYCQGIETTRARDFMLSYVYRPLASHVPAMLAGSRAARDACASLLGSCAPTSNGRSIDSRFVFSRLVSRKVSPVFLDLDF